MTKKYILVGTMLVLLGTSGCSYIPTENISYGVYYNDTDLSNTPKNELQARLQELNSKIPQTISIDMGNNKKQQATYHDLGIQIDTDAMVKAISTYGYEDNKVYATNHIDLQIEEGSFVAIVGRSGSGKSTLLHILAGLVKPTKGEVYLEGKSLYEMNDHTLTRFRRRRMGFVFQFFNLISTQNVLENIVLPIHLDDGEIDNDYLNEIINLLGLEEKKNSFIYELSGGQQQRVALARALASKPAIIFADEPTGNLDAKSSKEVVDLLKIAQRKYHETVILVTHDQEIASIADRVITIEDGKIIQDTNHI